VPRWKAGGYVIQLYATDHPPLHVHVFRGRRLVARYDLHGRRFMPGSDLGQAKRILRALRTLGLVP
jgi:hypothetical protein